LAVVFVATSLALPMSPPMDMTAAWSNVLPKKAVTFDLTNIPDLVVVVPSMRRWSSDGTPAPTKYLQPLVDSMIKSMTPELKPHVTFLLLNVDPKPKDHTELLALLSRPNVTLAQRALEEDITSSVPLNEKGMFVDSMGREISAKTLKWRAGETRDVSHLLLQAMPRAPYVLMLEDDVKATSEVLPKIFHMLDEMNKSSKQDFFMVDLYTPAISWGPQSAHNLMPYDYECCTQAMLFNSKHIDALVAYELGHPENPLDDNIRDFVRADRKAHPVYAMVPNPFEHIGAYSSNPEKSKGIVEHHSLYFEP